MKRSLRGPARLISMIRAGLIALVLLPILGAATAPTAAAQDDQPDEVVIFVLDLSGSMNEPFDAEQTKLDAAKAAFVEAFADVSPNALVGLRTYGDQIEPTAPGSREASCTSDTRLVSPVAPLQRDELISRVQDFSALGDTPMALALAQASTDIPAGARGTIVLFSDGRDECFDADLDGDATTGPSYGQDPCEVAKEITGADRAAERVVTVGFRADSKAEAELRCIAESTGGTYTSIQTPEDAQNVLPELLVQLSAPRQAQRMIGREIQGTARTENAPSLVRLDEVGANSVLYADTIDMNSQRVYRFDDYGPEGGTFTATVFGLPAEANLKFDLRMFVPRLERPFFRGEHGDFDAGLPARSSASIRCTACMVSGGPYDVFWVVSLDSPNTNANGTFELEILTEGPGFGGVTTSCAAPQACFYPQEIIERSAELEEVQQQLSLDAGTRASDELIAERDQLRSDYENAQATNESLEAEAVELEALIPTAPAKSNTYTMPLLMIVAAVGLAVAPLHKLKRDPKPREGSDPHDTGDVGAQDAGATAAAMSGAAISLGASGGGDRTGLSIDVGPAPAVSNEGGRKWDAELEAAKVALAGQRKAHTQQADAVHEPELDAPNDGAPAFVALPAAAAVMAPQSEPATAVTKGWYRDPSVADPSVAGQFRWWDGTQWTGHTRQPEQGNPES